MRKQTIQSDLQNYNRPRSCTGKRRANRRKGYDSRLANAPSPALIPVNSLLLPSIPRSIPKELLITRASAKSAKIALLLIELGLVKESDVEEGKAPHEVIASALTRWLEVRTNEMKDHFIIDLYLIDSLERMGLPDDDLEQLDLGEPIPPNSLKVAVHFTNPHFYILHEKTEAVETIAPGLGEHALSVLYSVLHRTQFAVTPNWALDIAKYEYWQGEDNEQTMLEEFEMNEEEYDGLTRAEFDSQIPLWVSEPRSKLSKSQIKVFAKEKPELATLCKLLLKVDDIQKSYAQFVWTDNLFSDSDCYNIDYGCILSWKDGDPVCRVLDDWGNYIQQMGTCDMTGIYFCQDSKEGIADLLRRIDGFLKYITYGAKLLSLLGTKEEN